MHGGLGVGVLHALGKARAPECRRISSQRLGAGRRRPAGTKGVRVDKAGQRQSRAGGSSKIDAVQPVRLRHQRWCLRRRSGEHAAAGPARSAAHRPARGAALGQQTAVFGNRGCAPANDIGRWWIRRGPRRRRDRRTAAARLLPADQLTAVGGLADRSHRWRRGWPRRSRPASCMGAAAAGMGDPQILADLDRQHEGGHAASQETAGSCRSASPARPSVDALPAPA